MPLMHFGFGGLHREGKLREQTDSFIDHILIPKQLKSFICPEFLPIMNSPTALMADPDSVVTNNDGSISFEKYVKSPPVALLPNDIPMICFVDIPFKKLKSWHPTEHYGKLGISFTDSFRKRLNVTKVFYYKLPNLEKDNLVIECNKAMNSNDSDKLEQLTNKITHFRKPSILWPEFNSLFAPLHIKQTNGNTTIEKITYSRYPVGYDFESEQEARIITKSVGDHVEFTEQDILSIIVPTSEIGDYVCEKLKTSWTRTPDIMIHPQI